MSRTYPRACVRDVAIFLKGKKPSVTFGSPTNGAMPYILIENFGGQYTSYTDDPGCVRCERTDTLIVADGANTGLVSTGHAGYIGSTLGALRPDRSKADPRYLFYFVRSHFPTLNSRTRGAAVPHLDRELLLDLEFVLPPLGEQERVARILEEAESLIRLRAEADHQVGTLIGTLFLEVFGDPTTNPKGWTVSNIGDQLSFMEYGPRFYNESYSLTGPRIVRITDLDSAGNLDFQTMPRQDVDAATLASHGLKSGDLIFARSGATVGKAAVVPEEAPPCIAGAYFIRLHFKDNVHPLYALAFLRSSPIQDVISRQSKQAAQPNFSGPLIRALPLPLPPVSLQRAFAASVEEIHKLEAQQAMSRKRLDHLFQSLLHRMFTGKL